MSKEEKNKIIFQLRPEDEFIELMKLLKLKNIAQSGGHAKIIINNGEIKVNDEIELKKRKKLRSGDIIVFENVEITIVN